MQNPSTGHLEPIDEERYQREREKLAAGNPHARPVFKKGEILEIRGGRFRVQSIGKKVLVLRGLPGTKGSEGPAWVTQCAKCGTRVNVTGVTCGKCSEHIAEADE